VFAGVPVDGVDPMLRGLVALALAEDHL
jgi:hypothetical protein